MHKASMERVVDEAIRRLALETGKSPSTSLLANYLGINRQAIEQWHQVPVHRVLKLETLTGISRHEMRPDIYGDPPSKNGSSKRDSAQRAA